MNLQIEVFHEQLIKLINECGLPIGAAYYVVKDCLNDLSVVYNKVILEENQESAEDVVEEIPVAEVIDKEEYDE